VVIDMGLSLAALIAISEAFLFPAVALGFLIFLIACGVGKNPYYQDNLVEITDQDCNVLDECKYTINFKGTELTVPESDIEWK